MTGRFLIAGVGNIFFGDDAFGCEVVSRLRGEPLGENVRVEDYGIRGTHLAFELMSGYAGAILVDALPKGGEPGTLYVVAPDLENAGGVPDAHSMDLGSVFAFMRTLEGEAPRIIIIGCEPKAVHEQIGLSEVVDRAVGKTIPLVREVLEKYFTTTSASLGGSR